MRDNRYLVVIAALVASPTLWAYECGEASPNYLELGEAYYQSDNRFSVSGDEPALAFMKTLQGDWQGDFSEVNCDAIAYPDQTAYRQGEVDVEVRSSNTALFLADLNKDYDDGYLSRGDEVFLMDKDSLFLLRVNDKRISAQERERRVAGWNGSGSRFVEVFSEIQLHNADEMQVNWFLFSNGYFVFSQHLTLERD